MFYGPNKEVNKIICIDSVIESEYGEVCGEETAAELASFL